MQLVTALAEGAERGQTIAVVPLRCWDARARVSDYLDDELDPDERAVLEAHLARCPTCPPLYHGLVSARGALGALRDPDSVIPPGLVERVRGRLAAS